MTQTMKQANNIENQFINRDELNAIFVIQKEIKRTGVHNYCNYVAYEHLSMEFYLLNDDYDIIVELPTFTTKDNVIKHIEDGMGSEGSLKVAQKMYELLENQELIYFDSQLQEYVWCCDESLFMEYWEKADKKIEKELLQQITDDDLTEIPQKLKEAIITKRDNPEQFSKQMYQNVYHNLLKKGTQYFTQKQEEYRQKKKITAIFEKIEV
jgi:hypothetical protein